MVDAAIETASRNLSWYNEETQNSVDIINKHQKNMEWLIGCHSACDIENIKMFAGAMNNNVHINLREVFFDGQ